MGHCEMGLAVAGLAPEQIEERTRRLAGGDWSSFPADRQVAFAFTRKQARDLASVTRADLEELERHWGKKGALQVVWWSARCHYMTRVADAFGLPLEKDNVFLDKPAPGGKK
jgi:hypothetical protein